MLFFCAGCCAFCLPRCEREKDGVIKGKGFGDVMIFVCVMTWC